MIYSDIPQSFHKKCWICTLKQATTTFSTYFFFVIHIQILRRRYNKGGQIQGVICPDDRILYGDTQRLWVINVQPASSHCSGT